MLQARREVVTLCCRQRLAVIRRGQPLASFRRLQKQRDQIVDMNQREPVGQEAGHEMASESHGHAKQRQAGAIGLAYDLEEHDLGTCAVVAPVRDQTGALIATMGVVVPAGRFGPEARDVCSRAVRETAAALSEYCGYARSDQGLDRVT